MGLYGKIYNRVDGPTIIGWLREYLDDKYEVKETQLNDAKAAQDKIEGTEDPKALAMLSKIRQGLEAKDSAAKAPDLTNRETLEGWLTAVENRAAEMTLGELNDVKRQLVNSNANDTVSDEIQRIDELIHAKHKTLGL